MCRRSLRVVAVAVSALALLASACGTGDDPVEIGQVIAEKVIEEKVRAQVADAVERYDDIGEAAFEEFTSSGDYIDGEVYLYVLNIEGVPQAHAANPDLVGQNLYDLQDSTGAFIVQGVLNSATPEGVWTNYRFTNPVSGEEEPKRSWAVLHDDLVFGSGYYTDS